MGSTSKKRMEIILKKRVEKLGQIGDIVSVKPGYANNFLIRGGYADVATKAKIAAFQLQRTQIEAENLQHKIDAQAVAVEMHDVSISLVRQAGDTGILYGSIRTKDIADALTLNGYTVDRHQVRIKQPIKTIGVHHVDLVLHAEVIVSIKVVVALSLEEAQMMLSKNLN